MKTTKPWYSSVEAQQAFLTLPEGDQITLELKHKIEADAMNVIHRAKEAKTNLPSEKSIFLESIDSLKPLSQWIKKILHKDDIHYIGQLVLPRNAEVTWIWEKKRKDLNNVMDGFGLHIGMPIPEQDIQKVAESFYIDDLSRELYWESFHIRPYLSWPSLCRFFVNLNNGPLGSSFTEVITILNNNGIFYYGQIRPFTREELCALPGMTKEMMDELDSVCQHGDTLTPTSLQISNDRINQFASWAIFFREYPQNHDAMNDFAVSVMLDNWLEEDIPDCAMKAYQSRQQEP